MATGRGEDRQLSVLVRSCVFRAGLFAVLWWVLVDGDNTSWPIGALVVLGAVAVSMMATGSPRANDRGLGWRWVRWLAFFPYFVWASVLGAVDVARRAYAPRPSLTPTFHDYAVRLSTERAQVFFANVVSLLPGTLSAELQDRQLVVHALDNTKPIEADLAALEEKVAPLFGQDLAASEPRS